MLVSHKSSLLFINQSSVFIYFSHPSSLQRHYRQCKHQSAFRELNSNSKTSDETMLKPVTNMINQQKSLVDS